MEFVTLNNGLKMPKLGYGVYQVSKEECERCVSDALEIGYRHIDTAQAYFNEAEVGRAVKVSGIKRDELFITTKVWISNYGYDKTKASVYRSLELMGLDYLDLMLLHQPFSDYYGAYRALEDLQTEGVLKSIGVSNFYPRVLADLVGFNRVVPQVNQVEVNPLHQQVDAHAVMDKLNVQIEAWAPFGEGRSGMFTNEVLQKVGTKHGKSVAQVILRYLMQRNVVALAKSTHKERMQENFNIFDFTLDDDDMKSIAALDTKNSLFFDHASVDAVDLFVKFTKAVGENLQ